MAKISEAGLRRAERHLANVARNLSGLSSLDIDWHVVRKQLRRLQSALTQGDGMEFGEALSILENRLPSPKILRGQIGPDPKNESVMPREVFELVNHVVDTLNLHLNQPPDKEQEKQPNT